jgi:phosphopantothenoylcysteine decarboxylase/phosphopantothenate--cysteine ligase
MASAMATALYCRGADVNLISTKHESNIPTDMHMLDVEDSKEMLEYLVDSVRISKKGKLSKATLVRDEHIHLIQKKPYLFMAAAVSDYIPAFVQEGKLKKEMLGETFELALKKNIDILSSIDKEGINIIGFKAEMDAQNAMQNAQNMLTNKHLNAVCLNVLKDASSFGSETNAIEFITDSGTTSIATNDKLFVAFEILNSAKSIKE